LCVSCGAIQFPEFPPIAIGGDGILKIGKSAAGFQAGALAVLSGAMSRASR